MVIGIDLMLILCVLFVLVFGIFDVVVCQVVIFVVLCGIVFSVFVSQCGFVVVDIGMVVVDVVVVVVDVMVVLMDFLIVLLDLGNR